jgi:signal transduction histidine kinase
VGRQEIDFVSCDVTKLAHDVAAALRARDDERSTEIVIDQGLHAYADPRLLRIALDNLLDNAWKFTSKVDPSKIELTTCNRHGKLEFIVRDNGVGFDMAHAGKLFAPFQRLHREEDFPGTGIGLAIVHRIIVRHGGQIRAESAPGAGTSFAFTLPANRGVS